MRVMALMARALSFGVHVMVSSNRWADFRQQVADALGSRLELRLGDASDTKFNRKVAAGVPLERPGRGQEVGTHHVLVALPRADGDHDPLDPRQGRGDDPRSHREGHEAGTEAAAAARTDHGQGTAGSAGCCTGARAGGGGVPPRPVHVPSSSGEPPVLVRRREGRQDDIPAFDRSGSGAHAQPEGCADLRGGHIGVRCWIRCRRNTLPRT